MNTTSIEEIRARFKPLTAGGFEYHIYEQFGNRLFGRVSAGGWHAATWNIDGGNSFLDTWDLVPVPQAELIIQWDKIPEWMDWFALDSTLKAFAYSGKPLKKPGMWSSDGHYNCFIPPAYYTNTGVPWDKSLRQRPAKT